MQLQEIRNAFPALDREVNGQRIAYLDNAATSQKPQQVIDAVRDYYQHHNANVHRCVHALGEEATAAYDQAHRDVAAFINADMEETVFAKNTTEAINLIAYSYGLNELDADDEILLTEMEHHSMIVPWQMVAEKTGATLKYVAVDDNGFLDMDDFHDKISEDTAVVGVTHVSNVLGVTNPIAEIADAAHDHDAVCVVDAAQSVPHMPVDVEQLGCDFLVFSGHKMMGPTGIGVLYGRKQLLEEMDPFLRGGDMIARVGKDDAEWNDLPWKFEAGTPNIAGAVGLSAAVDYLQDIGMEQVQQHSTLLAKQAYQELQDVDHVTVYGPEERISLVSFTVDNAHPHDVSTLLNEHGVAVRGGHHCAQPLSTALGIDATARASFYVYNTVEEVERLANAVKEAAAVFN